jgi:hypothetical protein
MKKFVAFCLLLMMALPAVAVEDDQVMYVGGTTPELKAGVVGRLDMTPETALIFNYSGSKLAIPYASIDSFQYTQEVTRHLGVLPAIAIGLVTMRRHRHFFRISYRDPNNVAQAAVFEVPKTMPRTLQAVLETRAPRTCKPYLPCAGRN